MLLKVQKEGWEASNEGAGGRNLQQCQGEDFTSWPGDKASARRDNKFPMVSRSKLTWTIRFREVNKLARTGIGTPAFWPSECGLLLGSSDAIFSLHSLNVHRNYFSKPKRKRVPLGMPKKLETMPQAMLYLG